jgi:ribonuclease Z
MTVRDLIILGCSSQQPTRKRNQGGYLLRWNEEGFLFDPGEGTQRQFIFAEVAPTCVTRIFVSHFHGDHCLGLGSMLMRLNLDKITHPIHCYYPASGRVYFDRLRYGTIYHETIRVVEHPISHEGIVDRDEKFTIEAYFLEHGIENIGWRIKESDQRKFNREKLVEFGVKGALVQTLEREGSIEIDGRKVLLDQVSWMRKGDLFAIAMDTLPCAALYKVAEGAKLFLCESTYLEEHRHLAKEHRHLTARQAAEAAKKAGVKKLILTHFSARYLDLNKFLEEARSIFPNTHVADDLRYFPFER